jgi:drug/metabolite transporter (DMT)-like permease
MSNAHARAWLGPSLLVAGALCIGFAPIGLRLSAFGPQATGFWRYVFALPILAGMILATAGRIRPPNTFALIAGVFFGLDIAFWHASLHYTSVANATFLVNLGNAAVGLLAWVFLAQKPARTWFFALPVALAGALLLSRGAHQAGAGLSGDLLALVAALMVGLYFFFATLARRTSTALEVMFWSTVVEAVVGLAASLSFHETLIPPHPAWFVMPILLAVGVHATGQSLIVAGAGRTPASAAGVLLLLQPVAAGLIAWPLFHEELTSIQLAGAGLILIGVWLTRSQSAERASSSR